MEDSNILQEYEEEIEKYLEKVKQLAQEIVQFQYFQEFVVVIVVISFFFLGRLSYDKRFTHLLQMVNDAEIKKQKLTAKLEKNKKMFTFVSRKKFIVYGLFAVLVVLNIAYCYLSAHVNLNLIIFSVVICVMSWLIYFLPLKYFNWKRNEIQYVLKNSKSIDGSEILQVIKIFGQNVEKRLQALYQSDIQSQWLKEQREPCKLYQCYNQKTSYENLFKLYQEMINQIKQVKMCDICLSQSNINVQNLGLTQMENALSECKRVLAMKTLVLQQKKSMVNRLLILFQNMKDKPNIICKKGCCVNIRVQIQSTKSKFNEKLKRYNDQLKSKK